MSASSSSKPDTKLVLREASKEKSDLCEASKKDDDGGPAGFDEELADYGDGDDETSLLQVLTTGLSTRWLLLSMTAPMMAVATDLPPPLAAEPTDL